MSSKKLFACVLAWGLVLGLFCGLGTAAQEMTFFRIGTGGTGGTYYPIGGLVAHCISNPPGSRPCEEGLLRRTG